MIIISQDSMTKATNSTSPDTRCARVNGMSSNHAPTGRAGASSCALSLTLPGAA